MTEPTTPEELNAWHLAGLADCASPDTLTSPGAKFLTHVYDAVTELLAEPTDAEDRAHEATVIADHARRKADRLAQFADAARTATAAGNDAAERYDDLCDHVGTERIRRTAHGYLGDAPAGTVQTLCVDCGTVTESTR